MSLCEALLGEAVTVIPARPWPRIEVDEDGWRRVTLAIAAGHATLLDLWADGPRVLMGVIEADAAILIVSLDCPDGHFPSVGVTHAPAQRLERAIRDLHGLEPDGAPDLRPWLDHGRWGVRHPLGAAEPAPADGIAYPFLAAEGPPLHVIPVGPVHAGIIEPGQFRFCANGETVVRLETRFGWVHKGIEGLMRGADLGRAARLAARVSGDTTVAMSLAFARAVEAALGVTVPARAVWLRALMLELERVAMHIGDVGAICNDAAFALMLSRCGILRERVLRAVKTAFGHRLMMDRVVPGGTAVDLTEAKPLREVVALVRRDLPALSELYDETASLQDRTVATGRLSADLARRWGAGGFIGRASGRAFDARLTPGFAPYDDLTPDIVVETSGDVDARIRVRLREITVSLGLIDRILEEMPSGPVRTDLTATGTETEGAALVEGFRGDVFARIRLDAAARVAAARLRDPSHFQWPLIEAAIEGNIVADFPLINKSFDCSYAGHDL